MFHVKHYHDAEQEQLFLSFLQENGLTLPDFQLEKLFQFSELVLEHNKITNLVSPKDSLKLLSRHIADSLIPLIFLKKNDLLKSSGEWADMGSGAGFPVFPLAICIPELEFYAVEPRKKRCVFLREAVEATGIKNLRIIEDSFENSYFSALDYISCRALGSLEDDFSRAKDSLSKSGSFLTLKSVQSIMESSLGKKAEKMEYSLPNESQNYVLVHLRKHG